VSHLDPRAITKSQNMHSCALYTTVYNNNPTRPGK